MYDDDDDESNLITRYFSFISKNNFPPLSTISIIAVLCGTQIIRKKFIYYEKDSFCFNQHRPFKTVFLYALSHQNKTHLAFNSIFLFILGTPLEYEYGKLYVIINFLASISMGTCYQANFRPYALLRGASAGSFGILGSNISDIFINYKKDEPFCHLKTFITMLFIAVEIINICTDYSSKVSYYSHLGGFIGGFSINCIHNSKNKFLNKFIGVLIYFGSILVTLYYEHWKPSLGTAIVGFLSLIFRYFEYLINKNKILPI